MTNQTKTLLGVGALAVAGYLYWKSTQAPATASYIGVVGKRMRADGKKKASFVQGNSVVRDSKFAFRGAAGSMKQMKGAAGSEKKQLQGSATRFFNVKQAPSFL
jgi:hypothetical protein